jgi:hypothetical protein
MVGRLVGTCVGEKEGGNVGNGVPGVGEYVTVG